MPLTRRKTLAILGGGAILAASGATYAVTRTPRTALKPWAMAGQYEDPRMWALSYAILAPNPHNRQPWMVDLSQPDQVTLYADPDRLLPHTDPFSRQIVVGLGCFLELMTLAAAERGYAVTLDLFPEGEDVAALDQRPVAVARFREGGTAEPALFSQAMNRRTNRAPYDTARPVDQTQLAALTQAVSRGSTPGTTADPDRIADLRALTAEAFRIEFETPQTYRESVDLFRIGHAEIDANPDGISLGGPKNEALRLAGLLSRESALDRDGVGYATALGMVTESANTGMGYVWLTSAANRRADQIAAGRDWLRVHLAATAEGLALQPMSQALQEFPEMAGPYREAHSMLAPEGGIVQMLGRLGYAAHPGHSPRWPLETRVM